MTKLARGLTLIEVSIVLAVFTTVVALTTVNFIAPQRKSNLEGATTTLVADIKQQQAKAMAGDTEGQSTVSAYDFGICLQASNKYTLFRGSVNCPPSADNFDVTVGPNLSITTTFPTPNQAVIFTRRSGEVAGFVSGSNTITVVDTQTNQQKIITINKYGAVTVQ